jgi:hypothetical protein
VLTAGIAELFEDTTSGRARGKGRYARAEPSIHALANVRG